MSTRSATSFGRLNRPVTVWCAAWLWTSWGLAPVARLTVAATPLSPSHRSVATGPGLIVARRRLETFYDQYLLTEVGQCRYRMHDLVRAHARALAARLDPDRDRDGATADVGRDWRAMRASGADGGVPVVTSSRAFRADSPAGSTRHRPRRVLVKT